MIVVAAALLFLAASLGMLETPFDGDTDLVRVVVEPVPYPSPLPSLPELPEADLRSAITELCTNRSRESGDKEWTPEETQAQIEAFNELKRNLSGRLSVSSSAEHLHLAALLEDDSTTRIELLDRAISQSPNDAFLLWRGVQICTEEKDATACDLADWERQLLMIDGQNSESWLRVAANRYKAGETDAALEAMRHAATAAETRIYWTENIEMIERGLAAAGSDYPFPERAGMAFGFAAMKLPNYGDFTTMCKEQSLLSADWAYTCLGYGELAENQGKTEIGVSFGLSLQKLALDALGELEKEAEVEQRLQARRQERLDSIGDYNPATERLIFSNPALFSAYLAAVRSQGEVAAQRYIRKETERILEQQPELACESN